MKTSFIYSGRKCFCRRMDVHIIGRESNSVFLSGSQIYLCYFLHLWLFNRTPFGGVVEDSLPITSWLSKTFLQWKWWHLKKQRDAGPPLVISGIVGISFFPFFNFPPWYKTTTCCLEFFHTTFQIPLSPPFKVSILRPSSKIRPSHLYYSSNLFQSSYLFKPTQ